MMSAACSATGIIAPRLARKPVMPIMAGSKPAAAVTNQIGWLTRTPARPGLKAIGAITRRRKVALKTTEETVR